MCNLPSPINFVANQNQSQNQSSSVLESSRSSGPSGSNFGSQSPLVSSSSGQGHGGFLGGTTVTAEKSGLVNGSGSMSMANSTGTGMSMGFIGISSSGSTSGAVGSGTQSKPAPTGGQQAMQRRHRRGINCFVMLCCYRSYDSVTNECEGVCRHA